MSYKFLGATDLFAFINLVKTEHSLADAKFSLGNGGEGNYLGGRDVFQSIFSISGAGLRAFAFNPSTLAVGDGTDTFIGTSASDRGFLEDVSSFDDVDNTFASSAQSPATGFFREWDINTQVKAGILPSNISANTRWDQSVGTASSAVGGYSSSGNVSWLIFRGLTDGVPGGIWPNGSGTKLTGTNVYPGGLGLTRVDAGTLTTASDMEDAIVWVDLATAAVVGVLQNTAGKATSFSTAGNFLESPIAGNNFEWHCAQFIPDTDSTAAAPKGELFLTSNGSFSIPGSAEPFAIFTKLVDFNPFSVVASGGAPSRTHEGNQIISALEFDDSPMFGVSGAAAAQTGVGFFRPFFHRPTQRFMLFLIEAGGNTNIVGENFLGSWSREIVAASVTAPVSRDVPRTNDIIQFESSVSDNLGQGIAGVDVDWTLFKNSSELEALTVSGGIGTTSTVANGPIDEDSASVAALAVIADGTPLVLTTDYTVVASTGVITWVTDQSGATLVTATYDHRQTDAASPHGSLLSAVSTSLAGGRVTTQVSYPDQSTLVGTLDRIKVDLA